MNRALATLFATAAALVIPATALAAPPVHIPQNCHEWNELLHIDNVRSCDGS
jgi:hypothetical protein